MATLTRFGAGLKQLIRVPIETTYRQKCLAYGFRYMSSGQNYEFIKVEKRGEKQNIGLITLNRKKKAFNAFCEGLMKELGSALESFDSDQNVGAIVLTGSEKAFAAGADIQEMKDKTFTDCIKENFLEHWDHVVNTRKPIIAAVNRYALGGGCELAMMCDIIYVGDGAKFGQPEIALGTIPGAGGTQRLTHAIGKSRAMELVLSGNQFTAQEAEHWGLVSRGFPADKVVDEAVKLGEKISSHSKLIVSICKDSMNRSFENSLHEGLKVEKKLFHITFATTDRKKVMSAFLEKRKPNLTDS